MTKRNWHEQKTLDEQLKFFGAKKTNSNILTTTLPNGDTFIFNSELNTVEIVENYKPLDFIKVPGDL